MPTVNLGGIFTDTGSRLNLVDRAVRDCRSAHRRRQQPKLVFDVNGQGLATYYTDNIFRKNMNKADIIHADGGFIVALSKWLTGVKISERSATTDLIHDLGQRAERSGLSFYLLGGGEDINKAAADALQRTYPNLNIAGRHHGFFGAADEAGIIADIQACAPDILWVGLGKPKEQAFAAFCQTRLQVGWIITCGGCFDFLAGRQARAPLWMQNHALEWIFRLLSEPRRLFWRYFWTTPFALYLALRYSSFEVRETNDGA